MGNFKFNDIQDSVSNDLTAKNNEPKPNKDLESLEKARLELEVVDSIVNQNPEKLKNILENNKIKPHFRVSGKDISYYVFKYFNKDILNILKDKNLKLKYKGFEALGLVSKSKNIEGLKYLIKKEKLLTGCNISLTIHIVTKSDFIKGVELLLDLIIKNDNAEDFYEIANNTYNRIFQLGLMNNNENILDKLHSIVNSKNIDKNDYLIVYEGIATSATYLHNAGIMNVSQYALLENHFGKNGLTDVLIKALPSVWAEKEQMLTSLVELAFTSGSEAVIDIAKSPLGAKELKKCFDKPLLVQYLLTNVGSKNLPIVINLFKEDFILFRTKNNKNIAHLLFENSPTKSMVDIIYSVDTNLLFEKNNKNITPIDILPQNVKAYASQKVIKKELNDNKVGLRHKKNSKKRSKM